VIHLLRLYLAWLEGCLLDFRLAWQPHQRISVSLLRIDLDLYGALWSSYVPLKVCSDILEA